MNIQEILNMVDEDIARAEEIFCCPNWKHPVNWTRTGLRKNTWPCTLCINSLPDQVILSKYLTVKISLR